MRLGENLCRMNRALQRAAVRYRDRIIRQPFSQALGLENTLFRKFHIRSTGEPVFSAEHSRTMSDQEKTKFPFRDAFCDYRPHCQNG